MTVKNKILVKDCMSTKLKTLAPTDKLGDALLLTCSNDLRHIPVVDNGNLVGLISDRDLKRALPTSHESESVWGALDKTVIEDVMTRNVMTTESDITLKEAARLMMREKISALPVLDKDKKLIGIITTEDILWAYIIED